MPECPDCESFQVERRKANIPRNIKLRSIGAVHDPYVCRNCEWTGQEDDLVFAPDEQRDYEPATGW